jgi:putative spermidine/putrescine transport system permease protein
MVGREPQDGDRQGQRLAARLIGKVRPTRRALSAILLLAPGVLFLSCLFFYPLGALLSLNISSANDAGEAFRRLFQSTLYGRVFYQTAWVSMATTLICLIIGYPLARLLDTSGPRKKAFLLAIILLPFWSNFLVRTYGWMILLNPKGLINGVLLGLGLIKAPVPLVYNLAGVLIGMSQIMLPYMILPIAAVMARIDPQLSNAARSLGAGPICSFALVYFPMTLPGVMAGVLLVFTISLGFYVIPAILGGPRDLLVAQLIEFNINTSLDWSFATALSSVLLISTLIIYASAQRWFGLGALWGSLG